MKVLASILVLCCAVFVAVPARAELTVGDDAPKLAQGKYVQGEAVSEFEKGKVYVVEMWATWCGPCIAAIPHINELQKKHADKGLIVIGQNVWENDESKVEPFLKQMGEKMTYRVAMDDKTSSKKGKMAETWMEAAGQNGIPCSFIVNQEKKIAWIGHPMAMEKPLANVIEGKHDLAAAKVEHEKNMAANKASMELNTLARGGKWDEVLARLDAMEKANPEMAKNLSSMRFQALVETKQSDKTAAIVEETLKDVKDKPMPALQLAEAALRAKDYAAALKLSDAAAEHAKEFKYYAFSIQGRVHAAQQNWAKAVEAQKKALETAPERVKPQMERALKQYEEKAAPKPAA